MTELGVWLQNVHKEDLIPTEIIKCECDPDCGRLVYLPDLPPPPPTTTVDAQRPDPRTVHLGTQMFVF